MPVKSIFELFQRSRIIKSFISCCLHVLKYCIDGNFLVFISVEEIAESVRISLWYLTYSLKRILQSVVIDNLTTADFSDRFS